VPVQWVVSLKKPCAILAGNDRYAWHAIDACREVGIRVPEDVAILGVDNDVLLAEMVRPTLSSVMPDALSIGYVAAELLAELMKGKPAPAAPVLLPPEGVVTRHSTDVLAMDDRPPAVSDELQQSVGDEGGRDRQHQGERALQQQAAGHAEDAGYRRGQVG